MTEVDALEQAKEKPPTVRDCANALRALAMDAVEQAKSGHLGLGRLIVLWDDNRITIDGARDVTLLATGSDVEIALAASMQLESRGLHAGMGSLDRRARAFRRHDQLRRCGAGRRSLQAFRDYGGGGRGRRARDHENSGQACRVIPRHGD